MLGKLACHLPVERRRLGLGSAMLYYSFCVKHCLQFPLSELSTRYCANVPSICCIIIPGIKNLAPDCFVELRLVCHVIEGTLLKTSKLSGARAASKFVDTMEASALSSVRASSSSSSSSLYSSTFVIAAADLHTRFVVLPESPPPSHEVANSNPFP